MNALWQPSASIQQLRHRAKVLNQVRSFFYERDVLEVETPVLARGGSTDPYLDSMMTYCEGGGVAECIPLYLQTSPEFHMKRLLAAGSGAIWQMARSFRNGEASQRHNPEFSMLEWYRPGFELQDLMDEVQALLEAILGVHSVECCSYRSLFHRYLGADPFRSDLESLGLLAEEASGIPADSMDRETCCDVLMSHVIEPELGRDKFTFVYQYPAAQAALAKVSRDSEGELVAERFECYFQGIELANGYHELTDAAEQNRRFEADNRQRVSIGKPVVQQDTFLIEALASGLPECSGVALGFDRLVMLASGVNSITDVISFDISRA